VEIRLTKKDVKERAGCSLHQEQSHWAEMRCGRGTGATESARDPGGLASDRRGAPCRNRWITCIRISPSPFFAQGKIRPGENAIAFSPPDGTATVTRAPARRRPVAAYRISGRASTGSLR
jgi:hypothetical protein